MLMARPVAAALVAAVAAVVALLAVGATAPAKDLEAQLQAKEARLSEARERSGVLTTTISRYSGHIEALTKQVAGLRNREAVVRVRLDAQQARLDRSEAVLGVATRRLVSARSHLKRALVTLRGRLVAIYKTGTPEVLSVIVGADDYQDLVVSTEYLNRIRGNDEAIVGRVRDLRDEVRSTVLRLRAARNRIKVARDAVAAEEQALASARSAVQRRQSQLIDARGKRVAALREIRRHERELDGSVAKIQAKIAARLAGYGSAPLPLGPVRAGNGSGLIWPVDGPVVSGFGPRTINGSYEYHPGIDIAVPSGTPIRAAAAGTVIFTEPESSSGGYGNYTCIDHGGGLSTCYAHQESFAVSPGQQVTQGQVVGYSDCTGYCFGPHVHFEVRIDGEVTDPMAYL